MDVSSDSAHNFFHQWHRVAVSWIFNNAYSWDGYMTPLVEKFVGGVTRYIYAHVWWPAGIPPNCNSPKERISEQRNKVVTDPHLAHWPRPAKEGRKQGDDSNFLPSTGIHYSWDSVPVATILILLTGKQQDCFAGCRTQQSNLAASLPSSAGGRSKRFWNF